MQFRRAGIVWVATGNDAASAGAATTDRQVGLIKSHPTRGETIDVWRLNNGMPIATMILLGNIIGDEEDEVWPRCLRVTKRADQQAERSK